MRRSTLPKPTDAELNILRILWARGPSTVRAVLEHVDYPASGYTTVLKMLQIMTEKGLVRRDSRQRTHIYRAAAGEEQTQTQLLVHLLERAFAGSGKALVMRALSAAKASPEELREIRTMLEKLSGGGA
jgi:predicted transcriptional regulator